MFKIFFAAAIIVVGLNASAMSVECDNLQPTSKVMAVKWESPSDSPTGRYNMTQVLYVPANSTTSTVVNGIEPASLDTDDSSTNIYLAINSLKLKWALFNKQKEVDGFYSFVDRETGRYQSGYSVPCSLKY